MTNQARRPDSAPRRSTVRGGLAGAGLAGASLLVIGALIAVVWLGRPGSGPTGDIGGHRAVITTVIYDEEKEAAE